MAVLPIIVGFLNYMLLPIKLQTQTPLLDIIRAYSPLVILSTILGATLYLTLQEKVIEKINLFIKQKKDATNE